jgi:hypothetical protein
LSHIFFNFLGWHEKLRDEITLPYVTSGSWVRTPLQVWIYVYVYSAFVLLSLVTGLEVRLITRPSLTNVCP